MERTPEILLYRPHTEDAGRLAESLKAVVNVHPAEDLDSALKSLQMRPFDGVCVSVSKDAPVDLILELGGLLSRLHDGLLVLDVKGQVLWANQQAKALSVAEGDLVGKSLFDALGPTVIIGPEYSPINRAILDGAPVRTVLKTDERTYIELLLSPVVASTGRGIKWMLATVRDTSAETLLHQKQNAIVQAGMELADLQPEEIRELSQEDRVDLLRSRLMHYTQDILEFDNVEIRLLEPDTGRLGPLLALGVLPDAAERELYASTTGNGVTGFVAATGKSYLCADTSEDDLYLSGVEGARSSLTVPLMLNEQIMGTFNVESGKVGAFNETDQQYLELFCREVAVALNTLNLLKVEKAAAALEGSRQLLCEVAAPVDSVLNDAVFLLSRLQGQDELAAEKLRRILQQTRLVREKIHEVGNKISASCGITEEQRHPRLNSKRILVIDTDEATLSLAHQLLAPLGCTVETAHSGEEGLQMASTLHYDVALADIRLPDLRGFAIFRTLREAHQHLPVVLMTEFGYDGGHSLVKARQAGMKQALFKPFRPDLLIKAIENNLGGDT
ncbi:MAG: response regulator [Planctomycetaceae bacterium]